jgi:serine/threonine protein kinase
MNRTESLPPAVLAVLAVVVVLVVIALIFGRRRGPSRPRTPRPTGMLPSASLVGVAGLDQGKRIPLKKAQITIGRDRGRDLLIPATLVSRFHALLSWESDGWHLLDRDSTNGTWVNDRRIAEHVLRPNDQFRIGPNVYAFQPAGSEHTPQPQPSFSPPVRRPVTPQVVNQVHSLRDYDLLDGKTGGEGTVYRAVSRKNRSTVAIKILQSQDPYISQKFRQTAEMARRLLHPHIIRTLDFSEDGGTYYIVMEYANGGTLRGKLDGQPILPFDESIRIIGETCDALDYAHRQGVIHRDVKPSNILFMADGCVKLSDFGIAKLKSAPTLTQAGMILGTQEYMSYEQAKARDVVPESDVYSLGVVAYEMFTGCLPFVARENERWRLLDQHINTVPRPLRQVNPNVPPHIEAAVLKALEKDRGRRFHTAEQFARALGYNGAMNPGGWAAGEAATSRPAPEAQNRAGSPAAYIEFQSGARIPINPPFTSIGREFIGSDTSVSRVHATVGVHGPNFSLRDEGSKNGTWCNGQRVFGEWVPLQANDALRFGNSTARFVLGSMPGARPNGSGSSAPTLFKG